VVLQFSGNMRSKVKGGGHNQTKYGGGMYASMASVELYLVSLRLKYIAMVDSIGYCCPILPYTIPSVMRISRYS